MSQPQEEARWQLHAIHAMLDDSRHSVRLDPHTLVVWGLAGGLLCLVAEDWITAERFPEVGQRAVAVAGLVGGVLFLAGWLDWHLTARLRARREQTVSFVHQRIRRVWWYLMGLGLVTNVGMVFYGGGYLSYSSWLFLLGLALGVHGMFSRQPLAWVGAAMQGVAVGMVALGLEYSALRWITALALGLGLPLAGGLLAGLEGRSRRVQAAGLACWVVALGVGSLGVLQAHRQVAGPPMTPVSLEQWRQDPRRLEGGHVVALPVGTRLPVSVALSSDALVQPLALHAEVTLARPLQIQLRDGRPAGLMRTGAGPWRQTHHALRLRQLFLRAASDAATGLHLEAGMDLDLVE
ncbi:MAG: hypothetical protein H7831_11790 [Magnetococcus sp. WYHC-3]